MATRKLLLPLLALCACHAAPEPAELNAATLARIDRYAGYRWAWVIGWSSDGEVALTVDLPELYAHDEVVEQTRGFGGTEATGLLRGGENFGDQVEAVDTGIWFHPSTRTHERYTITAGQAVLRATPLDLWEGAEAAECVGDFILELQLEQPRFERVDGEHSFEVEEFLFRSICAGWSDPG
jgi:hypothetical protein